MAFLKINSKSERNQGAFRVTDDLQKKPGYSKIVRWKKTGEPVYQPIVLFSIFYLERRD